MDILTVNPLDRDRLQDGLLDKLLDGLQDRLQDRLQDIRELIDMYDIQYM